jgi:alkylation response protein AidB-like acyl-CoA dehydrogenase
MAQKLPDRNNPYRFDPYLTRRASVDYYADDAFLQKAVRVYAGARFGEIDAAARATSKRASGRWRELAESISRIERRPSLETWDGHRRRVDRVVRPAEALTLETEVFGEGLFSRKTDLLTRLVKMFLIYQNGESCVACPLVCTEGMVAVLEKLADRPETKAILEHAKEGRDGRFAVGAQFLSEIQGGSDVPANMCEAVPDGDAFRLYGTKFFCSVAHADYAVITAKPAGSESVGLFVAPLWDVPNERRNGLTVDRLKWKMGTCELPTAEMTFDGVKAWQVGPLDRGLANVVGVVLTLSRLTVGIASAAHMRRAAREARLYAEFREAFGRPIAEFPMVQAQLETMEHASRRATAGAFKIQRAFYDPAARGDERKTLETRELVMLQKLVASEDSTDVLREAMSIFGGHGVMEDFSSIPRLFRDSAVNELWEGPRNVLLAQIHRDLQRAGVSGADFTRGLLAGAPRDVVEPLAEEMGALIAHPSLTTNDAATVAMCRRWDRACRALLHAYQDQALVEIEGA